MHHRAVEQNPWWADPARALAADPKLSILERLPVRWHPPIDTVLDLTQDGVYTLRGQRQVGKSTYLKLVVQRLLERGWPPRRIMYLDVEGANATRQGQLQALIRGYLDDLAIRRAQGERTVVLLDEVTGLKNWQTAIRVLADEGHLRGVTLVATGSNSKDVKTGGDRLPRRRGNIRDRDLLLHPLSFRDYLEVTAPDLAAEIPTLAQDEMFDPHRAYEIAREVHLRGAAVLARFSRYLTTGGFLVSIAEEIEHNGVIPEYVYTDYRAAVLGEVNRLGRQERTLERVVRYLHGKLGEEFEWRTIAQETDIPRHETVRDLVDDLELAYIWHIVHRVKAAESCDPAFKSPKRLYPLDPFTWHMLSAWADGRRPGWGKTLETMANPTVAGKLAEAVAVDHVRRHAGPHIYYYRSEGGEEIDIVACRHQATHGRIELKYRNRVSGKDAAALRRHGGGLLLSKETLFFNAAQPDAASPKGPVAELPLPYALAMWRTPSLFATDG